VKIFRTNRIWPSILAVAIIGGFSLLPLTIPQRAYALDQLEVQSGCPGGVCPLPGASAQEARIDPSSVVRWYSTVRLTSPIKGGRLLSVGSGVILYGSGDDGLILTCAHLFRGTDPVAKIDLYGTATARGVGLWALSLNGSLVKADAAHDLALVRFAPGRLLPNRYLVARTFAPSVGTMLESSGFAEGKPTNSARVKVLRPRVLDPNDSYAIECSGAPVAGKSGGPLYTLDGLVAGICNFADTSNNTGLYAAVAPSAYALLDECRLTARVMPHDAPPSGAVAAEPAPEAVEPYDPSQGRGRAAPPPSVIVESNPPAMPPFRPFDTGASPPPRASLPALPYGLDYWHVGLIVLVLVLYGKGWIKTLKERGLELRDAAGSILPAKSSEDEIKAAIARIRAAMEREQRQGKSPADVAIAKILSDAIRPTSSPVAGAPASA
jgi:hypothetical protein